MRPILQGKKKKKKNVVILLKIGNWCSKCPVDSVSTEPVSQLMVGSMPNPRLRSLLWWRRWAKKDWAIAAVGFTVVAFALTLLSNSWPDEPDSEITRPFHPITASDLVELTLLQNAKARGALCLDGSAPGYHFKKGFGSGANNWLLHIEGGGWCNTMESCSWRKGTSLGSSKYMDHKFFNWNKVKIRYCDGASLAGHPENELKNGSAPFFRGQLIWEAVMDELLSVGLSKAKQALLSGCSAGGLATLIHCDDFRRLLPTDATVKCLADADVLQHRTMRAFYHDVVILQGLAKSLHQDCVTRMEPSKCLFPEEIIKNINTPVFLVNPAYDFWQIQHILIPEASDPHGYWQKCKLNIYNCNPSQLEILQGFRGSMLKALNEFRKNKEGGMFINSCFIHCQTWITETWHSPSSPQINNKTIAESVGNWYFSRSVVKQIDCPFPCNPTCYHMNFTVFSRDTENEDV
ncbi:Pectinacetylesterase family protein [Prunus dulcis]|uniref:Pectin acetylesterase n=1 Tax=Prunus dulcis TaxID=3755 RepID=A0A4Y1RQI4_PRUDU|nr:Pectinacetylesterase family protein [Prunus dulcis]